MRRTTVVARARVRPAPDVRRALDAVGSSQLPLREPSVVPAYRQA